MWKQELSLTLKDLLGKDLPSKAYDIKTSNPSSIGPDELLTVRFPDLKENQVIVPGTTRLTFNISLSGTDANRTLVVGISLENSL